MKNFFTSSLDPTSPDTFDAQIDALKAGESVYLEGVDSVRYMELYEKYKKERNDGKLRFLRDSRPTELDVFNTEKVETPAPEPAPAPAPEVVTPEVVTPEVCETPEDCEDECKGDCSEGFDGASNT
jgi:aryl carrier-like protein